MQIKSERFNPFTNFVLSKYKQININLRYALHSTS